MRASTQYNDYRGTSAADISDYVTLEDFFKRKGVNVNKYKPIGVDVYFNSPNNFNVRFICVDQESDENKAVTIGFEEGVSMEEFLGLFKRLNVLFTWNKGGHGYQDWDLDDDTIMFDNR